MKALLLALVAVALVGACTKKEAAPEAAPAPAAPAPAPEAVPATADTNTGAPAAM